MSKTLFLAGSLMLELRFKCQKWGSTPVYRGLPPYTLSQLPDNIETGYSNVLVQLLFGQCPNERRFWFGGASLSRRFSLSLTFWGFLSRWWWWWWWCLFASENKVFSLSLTRQHFILLFSKPPPSSLSLHSWKRLDLFSLCFGAPQVDKLTVQINIYTRKLLANWKKFYFRSLVAAFYPHPVFTRPVCLFLTLLHFTCQEK